MLSFGGARPQGTKHLSGQTGVGVRVRSELFLNEFRGRSYRQWLYFRKSNRKVTDAPRTTKAQRRIVP